MRRRGVAVVLLCGVVWGGAGGYDNSMAEETVPRNMVVIGWDGAQREHVREMIDRGEVPNLMALAREGRLVDIDVTTGATDTKAGWTQILTGYRPDKTGVFSNGQYQPIPVGYTLFERLEAFFGPTNIDTVAIIGKKEHVDADPPQKVPYEQWLKKETRQKRLNKKKAGLANLQGGRIVEADDEWTGKIAAKLKELGLYEKTRIYVVVDHGFNEGEEGHRHAPSVFLGTNDPKVIRNGDRADIAPTLLKRLGLDLARILPPLDGYPLDEPAP